MKLYFHPISSYSQKVLTALYEKNVDFKPEIVNLMDPAARAEYAEKITPMGKVPCLVLDSGWTIPESSIIIEYIDTHFTSGTTLIPADKDLARRTRFMDRTADLYLNDPMTTIFFDSRKPEAARNPAAVADAKALLDKSYKALDSHFSKGNTWALENTFTMADCAAAPALGYLRMVYPFEHYKHLSSYWNRLVERPSYHRALAEAAPYLAKLA